MSANLALINLLKYFQISMYFILFIMSIFLKLPASAETTLTFVYTSHLPSYRCILYILHKT